MPAVFKINIAINQYFWSSFDAFQRPIPFQIISQTATIPIAKSIDVETIEIYPALYNTLQEDKDMV